MRETKFTKIRLLLQAANDLFDDGEITADEFDLLVSSLEKDFNRIVKEMNTRESTEFLLDYINRLK